MRVMTFNLRFENDRDGENAWSNRREMVVELVNGYKPEILGTQEGKWNQLMYLSEHLPDYTPNLPDREPDEKSQSPTLFLRRERFEIKYGRDFWLSKTPDIYLSKDWDSAFPRMMSYAIIKSLEGQKQLSVGVTHLDHIGVEARYQQARIISEWVARQEFPVVLMGDFNDDPASAAHEILTEPALDLKDTWQVLEGREDAGSYTHHRFNGIPRHARMDWILVSPAFEVTDARIIRDDFNGSYPSDHYPYMADLRISGLPE